MRIKDVKDSPQLKKIIKNHWVPTQYELFDLQGEIYNQFKLSPKSLCSYTKLNERNTYIPKVA